MSIFQFLLKFENSFYRNKPLLINALKINIMER